MCAPLFAMMVHGSDAERAKVRPGRIRGSFLSQEFLMAQLVAKFELLDDDSWKEDVPVCKWYGVDCNDDGKIIEINWDHVLSYGEFDFSLLPATLIRLSLSKMFDDDLFTGCPDFTLLPNDMHYLDISGNAFSGTPDFTRCPAGLTYVDLSDNCFSGEISLGRLPSTIKTVSLAYNGSLSGHVSRFLAARIMSVNIESTKITII